MMRDGKYTEEQAQKVCGRLKQQLEGKEKGWIEEKAWDENERLFSGYITADKVDKQAERIPLDKAISAMTSYVRTGKLIDGHTNQIRGRPLAWKVEGRRILVKFGVYSRMPGDDKFWEKVKAFGKKGSLSIGGEPVGGKQVICQGNLCYIEPKAVSIFEVSFVEMSPANTGAKVKDVNLMAKRAMAAVGKKAGDLITEADLDAIFDQCAACQRVVKRFEKAGFNAKTARAYAKDHILNELQSALSDMTVQPASPEDAGLTTTKTGDEDVEEKDKEDIAKMVVELLKQEEAPPEEGAPAPEEGEAGGEEGLAAKVASLESNVAELAAVVSSLAEKMTGTEETVEEEAEEAAAIEEAVEAPPAEAPPEEAKEPDLEKGKPPEGKPPKEPTEEPKDKKVEDLEKVINDLKKSLHQAPARAPRGRVPGKPGEQPTLAGPVAEMVVKAVNAGKAGIPKATILMDGSEQLLKLD